MLSAIANIDCEMAKGNSHYRVERRRLVRNEYIKNKPVLWIMLYGCIILFLLIFCVLDARTIDAWCFAMFSAQVSPRNFLTFEKILPHEQGLYEGQIFC